MEGRGVARCGESAASMPAASSVPRALMIASIKRARRRTEPPRQRWARKARSSGIERCNEARIETARAGQLRRQGWDQRIKMITRWFGERHDPEPVTQRPRQRSIRSRWRCR